MYQKCKYLFSVKSINETCLFYSPIGLNGIMDLKQCDMKRVWDIW